MKIRMIVAALVLAVITSACQRFAVGPDLARRPSPFGNATAIRMVDPNGLLTVDVTARPEGDTAIATIASAGDKAYKADVTYRSFVPIVAETNAERRDYWLVGMNFTQTPDRSFYIILRHPHDQPLRAGVPQDFDYMALMCDNAKPAEDVAVGAEPPPTDSKAYSSVASDLGLCPFDTAEEVEAKAASMVLAAAPRSGQTAEKTDLVDGWQRAVVTTTGGV